ncbi:MAG: nucleotide-binding domain containing protein, partial [Sulfitobacter sp.]
VGLVDRMCVAQGADAIRAALADLADQGVAHVVVDAVADPDLEVIAEACQAFRLLTGGSALAMPLPALHRASGALTDSEITTGWQAPDGDALILSGSCSAMTQAQVTAYKQRGPSYRLDPLKLANDGVQPAYDWLTGQNGAPLIYATAAPQEVREAQAQLGRNRAGALIEDALAKVAVFARDRGVRRIVVAGGETSGAVTQALGVTRLDVGPEIAPGVPWCACDSRGVRMALALKSGNFGSESFFSEALQKLDTL